MLNGFYAWNTEASRQHLSFSETHKCECVFWEAGERSPPVTGAHHSNEAGEDLEQREWFDFRLEASWRIQKKLNGSVYQKIQVCINFLSLSESPFSVFKLSEGSVR